MVCSLGTAIGCHPDKNKLPHLTSDLSGEPLPCACICVCLPACVSHCLSPTPDGNTEKYAGPKTPSCIPRTTVMPNSFVNVAAVQTFSYRNGEPFIMVRD
jgi:hypothetical protein